MADPGAPVESLEPIREAARGRRRVGIDYFAHSSGEWSSRVIDPEEVFVALGHWYVAAWDVTVDAERLFRVDRIRRVEPTGEGFAPRGLEGAGRSLYTPTEDDVSGPSPSGAVGAMDRRVLRDDGWAGTARRVARHQPAREVARLGREAAVAGRERRDRPGPTRTDGAGRSACEGHARPIRGVTGPLGVAPFGGQMLKPGVLSADSSG